MRAGLSPKAMAALDNTPLQGFHCKRGGPVFQTTRGSSSNAPRTCLMSSASASIPAAEILIVAGDNPERIRSEAAFAKLAGISPIPTGSGMTSGKHRINHGGHRQLNAAIYRTVIVRMRFHEPTIAYVARRTAEGKSKRDIIRCLKRYVIREVYHLVKTDPRTGEIMS